MKNKVRELREGRGLTQKELADALGVTQQAVQQYEHGTIKPTVTTAIAMAEFFGCSVQDIFFAN